MVLLLKNLLFTLIVPGTVAVYVPLLIARDTALATGTALAAGVMLVALGAAALGWCIWNFASFGRATPLPLDAPRKLVIQGLYRHVRNPMYVAVLTIILGWAAIFQSWQVARYAAYAAVFFHLFVFFYEERRLRGEFGKQYEDYCVQVGRWLPRVRGRQGIVTTAAGFIGLAIAAQGIFGLAAPDAFVDTLRVIQTPPIIYGAAVVRFAFGVVLFRAAPASRAPGVLRVLGLLIVIGGLITPFLGERIGHAMLDWWSAGGAPLVRTWAGFSLALGVFIVYAAAHRPQRRPQAPGESPA